MTRWGAAASAGLALGETYGWIPIPLNVERNGNGEKQVQVLVDRYAHLHEPFTLETFEELWDDNEYAPGLGIWSKHLVEIEADTPEGEESLQRLKLGRTPTFRSLRGIKYLFQKPDDLAITSSEDLLGAGTEILANKLLFVPPTPGYSWLPSLSFDDVPLAPLPDHIRRRIEEAARPRKTGEPIPEIIREGARSMTLTSLAGSMRRRGASVEAITDGLLAENKVRCAPPLDDEEVRAIAKSVARYEPEQPSASEIDVPEPSSMFIEWDAFWTKERREPEWLLEDVLARGRSHAIYASRKSKKSLFTLAGAAQLVTAGHVVIYLDYEMTEYDVHERLEDMGYGPSTDLERLRYALLPALPPLDTRPGGDALLQIVDDVRAEWPDREVALIIDTTGRAVEGEENPSDTIRAFYRHTGIGLKRRGITCARLDHAGKDLARGQRGSSAKDDDVDLVWRLIRTDNGVSLHLDAARIGWAPSQVHFHQLAEPLRYVRVAETWPAGTNETAELLDTLNIPATTSVRAAAKTLRGAGHNRANQIVTAAQRYRRAQAEEGSK